MAPTKTPSTRRATTRTEAPPPAIMGDYPDLDDAWRAFYEQFARAYAGVDEAPTAKRRG